MRSKNYGINVRVTEQEKQKLLENARFCSLPLSEYLRRLGLGKEVKAAITERDYRLFRMLNGLKAELPQLQKEPLRPLVVLGARRAINGTAPQTPT